MTDKTNEFPKGFIWGAATSSYQIEGAWNVDGKGESIWDRFCRTSGNVTDGDTGDIACDHYHHWRDDIAIMSDMGLHAYRFSLSWPRILPQGRGTVNSKGLDFYSRLVDELLDHGIEPFITLYHWDLPQALQDEGGWPVRATAEAYAEYAEIAARKLGDRVKRWMTFNEPFVSAYIGYYEGRHAPGHRDMDEMLTAAHHLLLAHGWAVPVIRNTVAHVKVGIVLNLGSQVPASNSLADRRAAWLNDGIVNRWYLDPLSGRGYPSDICAHYGRPLDFIQDGDMEVIAEPLDFLGVNNYFRNVIRSREVQEDSNDPQIVFADGELTAIGWEVYPDALYDLLLRVHSNYNFPALYITENGAAFPDKVDSLGEVHDSDRIRYFSGYIRSVSRAISADIPVRGYFAWSLLDNFEWAYGFSKRFGLVYVDFESQSRILKDSARWYQKVIKANAVLP